MPVDTECGLAVRNSDDPAGSWNKFIRKSDVSHVLYTDGSRKCYGLAERTSYALVSLNPQYTLAKRINNHSSIFEFEALAVGRAVRFALDHFWTDTIVASDSLSVLTCLKNSDPHGNNAPCIYEIKTLYKNCLSRNLRIRFVWLPSHKNIEGNESADRAAKRALLSPDPFLTAKCHYRNLYSRFRAQALTESVRKILTESTVKGVTYFNKKRNILSPPWYLEHRHTMPAPVIKLISRLRTRHICVGAFLASKGIVASSDCPCGHRLKDADHVFFHCPLYRDDSDALISKLHRIDPICNLSIVDLAFSDNVDIYKALHSFVVDTQLRL
ncbi:uncharacterized protein LOC109860509 isoform X1 [Pseudomyrmex gracilis]|uniref:uncharacterized protein LOC109860509 isoform X1 n=1 Tax=Pseudomyrmex gracilis TaxID=219809 RepID=UPI000994DD1D|nr:uncharacterized protein LOC109860509 isoform X1 [Pseudomyrmex gracilis]